MPQFPPGKQAGASSLKEAKGTSPVLDLQLDRVRAWCHQEERALAQHQPGGKSTDTRPAALLCPASTLPVLSFRAGNAVNRAAF